MSKKDEVVYLRDLMDWVFKDKRTRKRRLRALLKSKNPVGHVKLNLGSRLDPKLQKHLSHLVSVKYKGTRRNALIHSGKTLKFIYDVINKGTDVPPACVCKGKNT